MREIKKEELQLTPYEYFKYCSRHSRTRAIGVITDKQFIFFTQMDKTDYRTHNDLVIDIENKIHPDDQKEGWDSYRKNNIYIASTGAELIIDMPQNQTVSKNQIEFLKQVLEETEIYNQEILEEEKKIKISYYDTNNRNSYFNVTETQNIQEALKNRATKQMDIDEELIIGDTLPKETVIENLMYHINLKDCSDIEECLQVIKQCQKLQEDSFYQDIIKDIFPDLDIVYIIITNTNQELFKTIDFANLNFSNIKNVLSTEIRNQAMSHTTIPTIQNFLISYIGPIADIKEEIKEEIFPNYHTIKQLLEVFPIIRFDENEPIPKLPKVPTNYEEFQRQIAIAAYQYILDNLAKNQSFLQNNENTLQEININKQIKKSKEYLNALILQKKQLEIQITEEKNILTQLEFNTESERFTQEKNQKVLTEFSSSFFQKLIHKKRRKKISSLLQTSIETISNLTLRKETHQLNIQKLKEEIAQIETTFLSITHFNYFPIDISSMDYYYNQDDTEYEKLILENIEYCKKQIQLLELQKKHIIESNLLPVMKSEEMEEKQESTNHHI